MPSLRRVRRSVDMPTFSALAVGRACGPAASAVCKVTATRASTMHGARMLGIPMTLLVLEAQYAGSRPKRTEFRVASSKPRVGDEFAVGQAPQKSSQIGAFGLRQE